MLVPEADFAVCKALARPPSDVVGNGTAFFLSDTGHDGNEQLAFTVQCIYALLLKVNRNAAFLQLADGGQGIDRVSGEAETDFVRIKSIFPSRASLTMRLKPSRRFVLVPVIPLSV